ncbi:hypothetical protein V2J09_008475 [Rumex salicifolius]
MAKAEPNSRFSFSLSKQSPVFFKFLAIFLCFGLAFRLFSSHSFYYPTTSAVETTALSPPVDLPPPPEHSLASNLCGSEEAKCDLFDGDWVPNPTGPVYTNRSCHIIESHQNCMKNGRPDFEYLKWKWSPRGCELPEFDANKFLLLMRNKSWAFIGDSISRNHVQSFVEPAVEIYHDEGYKSKKWRFPTYNLTVSVIWAPYLIRADIFEDDDGVSTSETLLHLDKFDKKWTSQYKDFDYVIIASGKWFLKTAIYYENDTVTGCHNCNGARNLTELGFEYAYQKTLKLVFDFITNSTHKPFLFLRTITPDHFENGEWDTGGSCLRKVPFKEDKAEIRDIDKVMREIELEEFEKAGVAALQRGIQMKILDTTRLSVLRPDGHPGPYRQFHPFAEDKDAKVQNDCLHWCLPGPIDSWNDIVMEMVVNGTKG